MLPKFAVCGLALASLFIVQVQAAPLTPGMSLFAPPNEPEPVGGTVLSSITSSFSSSSFSGTLQSTVIAGDASNLFPGGLTFTYRLNLNQASPQAVTLFNVSSFGSLLTDVSFNTGAGVLPGVAPIMISRSSEGPGLGEVIRFHFLSPSIQPGQSSALLVVQTSATAWSPTTAGISDGVFVNTASLAPIPVPEPGTFALLALGLGGFLCFRRRS